MVLKSAAVLVLLAAAMPAHATDWYYVDSADDGSNISFIDKDSIVANAQGNLTATMYSVLAQEEEGTVAFRFGVEIECRTLKSRLVTAESFDTTLASQGVSDMGGDWTPTEKGTQGETVVEFVCSKGAAYPSSKSLGSATPFTIGRRMLADQRAKGQ
jgi:hypothetical protein